MGGEREKRKQVMAANTADVVALLLFMTVNNKVQEKGKRRVVNKGL